MKSYKCILVGDSGVGKTAHVQRLVDQRFTTQSRPTKGMEVRALNMGDIRFLMWDTTGSERFITQADCGMVCFDLTAWETWNHVPMWYQSLSTATDKIVLVGFKSDLSAQVSTEEIEYFTKLHGIPYCAVSNKVPGDTLALPMSHLMVQLVT